MLITTYVFDLTKCRHICKLCNIQIIIAIATLTNTLNVNSFDVLCLFCSSLFCIIALDKVCGVRFCIDTCSSFSEEVFILYGKEMRSKNIVKIFPVGHHEWHCFLQRNQNHDREMLTK